MNGLMEPSQGSFKTGESLQFQFCALEYRPQSLGSASSRIAPVILLALRDREGNLHFLVHPDLPTIVQGEDLLYIQSLLEDFLLRATQEPEALFKQLSSLGVGPLITQVVGSNIADHPSLRYAIDHGFDLL